MDTLGTVQRVAVLTLALGCASQNLCFVRQHVGTLQTLMPVPDRQYHTDFYTIYGDLVNPTGQTNFTGLYCARRVETSSYREGERGNDWEAYRGRGGAVVGGTGPGP